ncbi:unnamed protein product, partial [Vitis vinifera]|uniref:Uncharacterized protein n=1 Tax=Vitis vinifera TaxID=29760 RepID=D7TR28_VITVI
MRKLNILIGGINPIEFLLHSPLILSSLQYWMALGKVLTLSLKLLRLSNHDYVLKMLKFNEVGVEEDLKGLQKEMGPTIPCILQLF